ncbi:AMP-binding protein [Microseira wollei]|uniref:Beta-ketoacyl synthase n=1 Tax=Microseira wollei NIES-4236 TaxID=2530354 RepID=A0AAV3WPR0_9CYAN|nr:AMP-binding protein [Microseira wollei]GET44094.1 beta-ketoacyl synthase [Microseira wollei NIES-4236]
MIAYLNDGTDIGDEVATLVSLLRYRAQNQPDKTAYTFLQDGEIEAGTLTYQELDRIARAIAYHLQSVYAPGCRAMLLYPPGLEFIAAFFGCLYAKVIAVPAYPPRPNQNMSRLQAIATSSGATLALTTTSLSETIKQRLQESELTNLHLLTTDNIPTNLAEAWRGSRAKLE